MRHIFGEKYLLREAIIKKNLFCEKVSQTSQNRLFFKNDGFPKLAFYDSQSIGKTGKQGKVSKIVPKGKDYQAGVEEERGDALTLSCAWVLET